MIGLVDDQKQNFAAQLRGLRLLLGQDNKPISGEAFSEKSGVALGTVRAVENGSRKLNAEDRRKIKRRLCAQWNDRKQRWVDARNERIPYSRQLYETYHQALLDGSEYGEIRESDSLIASQAVFYLLQKLSPQTYRFALFDLYDYLNDVAENYDAPPEVFQALKSMEPIVDATRNSSGEVFHYLAPARFNKYVVLLGDKNPFQILS
jgi:hypothetical protein